MNSDQDNLWGVPRHKMQKDNKATWESRQRVEMSALRPRAPFKEFSSVSSSSSSSWAPLLQTYIKILSASGGQRDIFIILVFWFTPPHPLPPLLQDVTGSHNSCHTPQSENIFQWWSLPRHFMTITFPMTQWKVWYGSVWHSSSLPPSFWPPGAMQGRWSRPHRGTGNQDQPLGGLAPERDHMVGDEDGDEVDHQQGQQGERGCHHLLPPKCKSEKIKREKIILREQPLLLLCLPANVKVKVKS